MNPQKFDLKDTRVVIGTNFKRKLLGNLLKNHGREKLSKELEISKSMLYHYKNDRVNNLSLFQLNKCLELAEISTTEGYTFIRKKFSRRQEILKSMDSGLRKRHQQLKEFRKDIPNIDKLIDNNQLNVEKWFSSYKKLIDFGVRKIDGVVRKDKQLIISHTNYVKGKKRKFKLLLPRYIEMNDDFCYFFGLWCGDRTGKGRIGVINKEITLNNYTYRYLQKLYQNPKVVILKSSKLKKLPKLKIKFDSVQEVKNMQGSYVPMIFSVNGILSSFFFYLDKQLDMILELLPNKDAFFAGLFDAEGNVFLEDRCFRWACKDQRKVNIYKKHLTTMNLFRRYDGGNLICLDFDEFKTHILPYLKHPQKINDTELICFGKGKLNKRFLNILATVKENNGSKIKNLAKALKRVKVHAQIRFLERTGYVKAKGYPKMIFITKKGNKSLSKGGSDR